MTKSDNLLAVLEYLYGETLILACSCERRATEHDPIHEPSGHTMSCGVTMRWNQLQQAKRAIEKLKKD